MLERVWKVQCEASLRNTGKQRRFPVTERLNEIFHAKRLRGTELYHESQTLATAIDDLVVQDGVDIFQSAAAKRMIIRLCGIESALGPVTSEATLDRADWRLAELLELYAKEGESTRPRVETLRRSLSKQDRLKKRLVRALKKWPHSSDISFEVMCKNIEYEEEDLRVIGANLGIGGTSHVSGLGGPHLDPISA
jgi:hypothetical protein